MSGAMERAAGRRPLVVLAAGGTGGHMLPAAALGHELRQRGYDIQLITDERGLKYAGSLGQTEAHIVEAASPGRGQGFLPIRLARSFAGVLAGTLRARRILKAARPLGVVGFGGYPALPAMLAARLMRVPYLLHEQNAVLGRTHRLVCGGARALALSFEGTRRIPRRLVARSVVTGTPVRAGIAALADAPYPAPEDDGMLRILVIGGSQGARILADVVPAAMSLMPAALRSRLQISQQARPEDLERVRQVYKDSGIAAEVRDFFDDVPERLRWTHLVVSRAGASTVSELAVAGRPAVLVPLAIATDDHQTANAASLVRSGGAWSLDETDFTPSALAKLLQRLTRNAAALSEAAACVKAEGRPEATRQLADLVEGALATDGAKRGARDAGGPARSAAPRAGRGDRRVAA